MQPVRTPLSGEELFDLLDLGSRIERGSQPRLQYWPNSCYGSSVVSGRACRSLPLSLALGLLAACGLNPPGAEPTTLPDDGPQMADGSGATGSGTTGATTGGTTGATTRTMTSTSTATGSGTTTWTQITTDDDDTGAETSAGTGGSAGESSGGGGVSQGGAVSGAAGFGGAVIAAGGAGGIGAAPPLEDPGVGAAGAAGTVEPGA